MEISYLGKGSSWVAVKVYKVPNYWVTFFGKKDLT